MGHGNTEKCEPNFTPLLDLVLQLVMFFMLATNFVLDQTSSQVQLPKAVSAKALDKAQDEVIYLNVNADGKMIKPAELVDGDSGTFDNPVQVEIYMKRRAQLEMAKTKKDRPEATIILRIDKATRFGQSYPIIRACRVAGYTKVELRAIIYSDEQK